MPIEVRVNRELGLLYILARGVVKVSEMAERLIPLIERSEYATLPRMIVDMTDAERAEAPAELLRTQARRVEHIVDPQIEGESRMAMVATRDEFFGLARMYQSLRGGSPVELEVFRSLADAEAWLELPDDYTDKLEEVSPPDPSG